MEENQKNQIVFSQSGMQIFLANNLEKFILIFVLIAIAIFFIYKETLHVNGLILVLCFLGGLIYAFMEVQKWFAYKIVVDSHARKLKLHMYRSNDIVERDFGAVLRIRVNGYIKFRFKDRNVYYNDLKNNELLECINKISKIEWGGMCAIWGPNGAFRDKLKRG